MGDGWRASGAQGVAREGGGGRCSADGVGGQELLGSVELAGLGRQCASFKQHLLRVRVDLLSVYVWRALLAQPCRLFLSRVCGSVS
jgi:hypothetical protein